MTYRTDAWSKAGIKALPTSLSQFTSDLSRLASANKGTQGFSPVYIPGTDWYYAMSFVYDYGGSIAYTHAHKWVGNLDSKASAELLAFMRRAVQEFGQTVVMVTHDPTAAGYADRVVFLADGCVVDEMLEPTAERVLDRMKSLGG